MARDGLFFPILPPLSIHDWKRPARSIAPPGDTCFDPCCAGYVLIRSSPILFCPSVIFIALTIIAVFVLRRKNPAKLVYMTPGYPVTPQCFYS